MFASQPFSEWEGRFVSLRPRMGELIPEPLALVLPVSGKTLLTAKKTKSDVDTGDGTLSGLGRNMVAEQLDIVSKLANQNSSDDSIRAECARLASRVEASQ